MKHGFTLLLFSLAFLLHGCYDNDNSEPTQPGDTINLACADVHNDADSGRCSNITAIVSAAQVTVAAVTEVDIGDITRSTVIHATLDVANNTTVDSQGFVEMTFNAGCNGESTWNILPKQGAMFPANQTYSLTVGGACSDMPLGLHSLTAIAWDSDGVTEIGRAIVNFNLIE